MPLPRFTNAVDKLMSAFIMGTLKHGGACSCAVGNLCDGDRIWRDFYNHESGKRKIAKTGYSLMEIYEIEKSFEVRSCNLLDADKDIFIKKTFIMPFLNSLNDFDGFKGLCNVFDYMTSIEDWSEQEGRVNLIELCNGGEVFQDIYV